MKKLRQRKSATCFISLTVAASLASAVMANDFRPEIDNVTAMLRDPSSAQFRSLRLSEGAYTTLRKFLCGEINAKNGLGGYEGFRRFYSERGGDGDIAIEGTGNPRLFQIYWSANCNGGRYERLP
jgi:hypothetical protein